MASKGSEAMVSNEMGDLDGNSLVMHRTGRPGKIEIIATKPLVTQRDLALAYSPGVAAPCLEIAKDPSTAYDYTVRGNLVAVISNGTAVLGLGDIGALASKPVMEGKAVLFKRFADVDCIDLEVDTKDVDEFVNCVRYLGPTFGGINLEDIKAPECFIIEQRLRELMDIPIFHDDQHGTAIVSAAGLINALHLTGRNIKDIKMVVNGAGAASIACIELVKAMGMPHENAILCDTKGVIYQGRTEGMNQWKSAHAVRTKARTLDEAMKGADVFFGLSVKGAVSKEMVKSMAAKPIIFAMANPDPEITPEDVRSVRGDAIIATGRSDYPNQINNVLGFPYIFRGALDVRATHDQRGDEGRCRRGAGQAGARGCARRGRPRLFRPPAALRAGIRHAGAVRSAPDLGGVVGSGAGGDGFRRRPPADPRHGGVQACALGPPRSDQPLAAEPVRPGEGQSAAHRVRRGRGGAHHPRRRGVPRQRLRHADPDRPRGAGARDHEVARHQRCERHGDPQCAAQRRATSPTPTWSTSACSATATCAATCSAWSTRAATCSAPAWWRWAMPPAW